MRCLYKIFFLSLPVLFSGCDDSITSEEIDNLIMPASNVSYKQHVAPVFEVKCVGCHNTDRKEGNVDLSSWTNVVADPSIVFPGSDSTSILVWTIEKLPPYPPMPPNEWLKRNHIDGIRVWIREGAQNN